jgi:hypothetical protein
VPTYRASGAVIEGALEAFCAVSMLARGCDGLIEEDVADMASKLVEKFLVKLLEGWIGGRRKWDEGDIRRNSTLLGGNRTKMGQEVRLVVVVVMVLFTSLAGAVGGIAAGCRRCAVVVVVVAIRVGMRRGLESAVHESNNFVENNI